MRCASLFATMKPKLSPLFFLAAIALACPAVALAQIDLSYSTSGMFTAPTGSNISIVNGTPVSTFATGLPMSPDGPTTLTFTGASFTGTAFNGGANTDTFLLGTAKIHNGITALHSTANFADMDLFGSVPTFGVSNFKLTTLHFDLENTPNAGGAVPDVYWIANSAPGVLKIGDTLVHFTIGLSNPAFSLSPGVAIPETGTGSVDLFTTATMTPVPEPSLYGLLAAAGLAAIVALRWRRRRSAVAV